jgi:hypothetical protein
MTSSEVSQSAVPILVLGDARRAALVARLTECVSVWLREWNAFNTTTFSLAVMPAHTESIHQHVADVAQLAVGCCAIGKGKSAAQLYVASSKAGLSGALGLPSHVQLTASHGRGLADNVVEQLVCSLTQTLLSQVPAKGEVATSTSCAVDEMQRLAQRDHWWLISINLPNLSSGSKNLLLAISPELVQQLSPAAAAKFATAVDKRRSAIGEESVRVEAILGEADISVGELASLAVNDVIVLRSAMSQPAHLATRSGRQVANAALGRVGNKRAVVIIK